MYTELLRTALAEPESGVSTKGEALASVLQCRARLQAAPPPGAAAGGASIAVADELSYDVALMRLARICGLESGPEDFESSPRRERARLEGSLAARGADVTRVDDIEPFASD
ncbi:MAG TPA: hypothetical protein VMF60_10210 [Acidimicrobiales bacterium]|nr:hypothetical protein [Acidimicrobiales bacterium]